MNSTFRYFIVLLLGIQGSIHAQEAEKLDLQSVIKTAKKNSPSYFQALNQAENQYWNYRQFRANYLPQLSLSGTFPNYSSSINRVLQPDGTFLFAESEQIIMDAQLSLQQNVALTGGTFSVSSALQRLDVREPVSRLSYFTTPFSISYNQPLVLYNALKWDNRIQPLVYEESQRGFIEDVERIATETTNLYFNALTSKIDVQIARLNVANNDTLFKISKGRYNLGKIAQNDLLQIELNLLNAQNAFSNANLDYEINIQALKRFLGIPTDKELDLDIPSKAIFFEVPLQKAIEMARSNRKAVIEFRRRRLEADQAVAQARGQSGYNLNMNANFGLSQQGDDFNTVYGVDPSQQNLVSVGVSIPLIDWGRAKANVKRAKANRDLVEVNVKQDEINFEQEVYLQVTRFNMQQQQLNIASKADTVAQKRYEVAKQRYLTGKITITDLNLAQSEKDNARKSYVNALRTFWVSYYTLRRLTLYDFAKDQPINYYIER
jgi:outer membrane protein TolC